MRRLAGIVILALFTVFAMNTEAKAADLENTLHLELKSGMVVIEMRP